MKDLVWALLILAAIMAAFSYWGPRPESATIPKGYGTRIQGDSGPVLPGDGTEPATATIPPEAEASNEARNDTETAVSNVPIRINNKMEDQNEMSDIIIAFWHGVGAVLLGEAAAILLALAWAKVKKGG